MLAVKVNLKKQKQNGIIKRVCVQFFALKDTQINSKKKVEIKNVNEIQNTKNDFLFHAGTKIENDKIYAIGGRVLNFVSVSDDFNIAKDNIIKNLDKLNWTGGFYRKDIGYKVLK